MLVKVGDSTTTDHISPAGAIKLDSPAGRYLQEHGVARKDFNSYGSRRGNHEIMIRGTFANIRIKNELLDGVEGGYTKNLLTGEQEFIYDAAQAYAEKDIPLVVLAGKEYGTGSSRDWAAKGTKLLGVQVVITESFERIHRSNLIGMGVLPLQFPEGESAESLGLDGTETFSVTGVTALNEGTIPKTVEVVAARRRMAPPWTSTRWSASTPPARRSTSATAASSSTSCARSSPPPDTQAARSTNASPDAPALWVGGVIASRG